MKTNREYQARELQMFLNQKNRYFDTVPEFSESLESMDIPEQIEWIEDGTYGAGACLALQHTLKGITPRANAIARIGQTVLHTFYGAPFTKWQKLTPKAQAAITKAVTRWMKKKHHFAMTLEN
jgi:hypothetical protein